MRIQNQPSTSGTKACRSEKATAEVSQKATESKKAARIVFMGAKEKV
jgi:hypothetical protein